MWRENRAWGGVADKVLEPPSELFKRHVYGCFFDDPHGVRCLEEVGVDNVTYETDYPHTDTTWPHTKEYVERILADVTPEQAYKILRGNAERLFRFTPTEPAIMVVWKVLVASTVTPPPA